MQKTNTIVYDLDGTLCTVREPDDIYYERVKPIPEMIEQLNKFHDEGYKIVIETARNMVTQNNDVGKVIKNIGEITLKWLRDNNVKYDSIKFGKEYGIIYIDDKACINDVNEIQRHINEYKEKHK